MDPPNDKPLKDSATRLALESHRIVMQGTLANRQHDASAYYTAAVTTHMMMQRHPDMAASILKIYQEVANDALHPPQECQNCREKGLHVFERLCGKAFDTLGYLTDYTGGGDGC